MQTFEKAQRWHEGLSAGHWMVLAIASAGWVFDVYEGQLFTIFKTPMLTELASATTAVIEWQGNLGLAAFLLGGAAGGLFFGILGDRFGRVRILAYTILVYSLFSALTAFAQSAPRCTYCVFWWPWAPVANGRSPRPWWPRPFPPTPAPPLRGSSTRRAFWAAHLRR